MHSQSEINKNPDGVLKAAADIYVIGLSPQHNCVSHCKWTLYKDERLLLAQMISAYIQQTKWTYKAEHVCKTVFLSLYLNIYIRRHGILVISV